MNAASEISIWTPDANTIGAVGAVLTTVYGLGHSLEKGVSIDGRQS